MESWKKTIYVTWCVIFLHGSAMSMFTPFIPLYLKELGIVDSGMQSLWSGLIIGAAPLFAGLMAPFWGTISDRYGRKPLIIRTTFGITIIAALMYMSTNVYQLLALRMLQGVFGGVMPAFTALLSSSVPKDRIGQGLGTMQSAIYSGSILGPFAGGMLADFVGYRNVFLVISFLTLVAGLATLIVIHEPPGELARKRETVSNNIKLVISSPNLRNATLAIFFIQFVLFFLQPILPLFIVSLSGGTRSATLVGLVFSITGVSTVMFAPYWGKAVDRLGYDRILSRSLLFAGIAFFPQALVTSPYQLLPLRAIIGYFIAGIIPSTQAMIVKNTKDSQRGGVLGITHSVHSLGHAAGPLIGGLASALTGFRFAIVLTSFLLISIWYFLKRFAKTSS